MKVEFVYHITFYEQESCLYSKGENFTSSSPVGALTKFQKKYPTAVFYACINKGEVKS